MNIKYEKEKTFADCRFINGSIPRFDFYLPELNYCIEFDGKQHFSYVNSEYTWNNEENFLKTQEHDNFKNQWCKENNIPLIRIPYWHLNKICLEDLLLNTSKFLI